MQSTQDSIKLLQKMIIKFRDERHWKKFHNPKDSAISLNLEAAELLEHFQWKDKKEVKEHVVKQKKEISEELSDILFWVLLMSHDLKIDIFNEFIRKLKKNAKKYPVEKAKGKHSKYNKL
jgi:NTP pyrophosphatase (non-canonical NTP hydrolase)